jgi:hypothetical protein
MWHDMTDDGLTADGDQQFLCDPVVVMRSNDHLTITCKDAAYELVISNRGLIILNAFDDATADGRMSAGKRAIKNLKRALLWEHVPTFWRNQINQTLRSNLGR